MSLLIKKDDGMLTRQVFAEMDDKRALGLIREYGYRQEQVYGIVHETIALRHEVDDQLVEEVLQRMPYRECHSAEAMLWAVRCIVPQATTSLRDAVSMLLIIPTLRAGLLRVCLFEAINRSPHNNNFKTQTIAWKNNLLYGPMANGNWQWHTPEAPCQHTPR